MQTSKSNVAWKKLIDKYNIIQEIDKNEKFLITSKQINEYRQARLMAKWDTYESLPEIFKKEKINILPISRTSYILGNFDLYENLPEFKNKTTGIKTVTVPKYESIDQDNINSESNAINVLLISNILSDFLNEENPVETFNGRMGTNDFNFFINQTNKSSKTQVKVNKAQIEIDSGLETKDSVIIIEAKNVINSNMNIRQLYYPYRLWSSRVKKPIRNIFSIYSNKIYKLLEYEFTDPFDFSSIKLIKEADYSIDNTKITLDDLKKVYTETTPIFDENSKKNGYPSLQANSISKLISMVEILADYPKTKEEIAEKMEFDIRQADYYFNAGRYLGIMENKEESGEILRALNEKGQKILKGDYKKRQLAIVSLILEHKLFHELFSISFPNGEVNNKLIIDLMKKYGSIENETTRVRRASTVKQRIRWIFTLVD